MKTTKRNRPWRDCHARAERESNLSASSLEDTPETKTNKKPEKPLKQNQAKTRQLDGHSLTNTHQLTTLHTATCTLTHLTFSCVSEHWSVPQVTSSLVTKQEMQDISTPCCWCRSHFSSLLKHTQVTWAGKYHCAPHRKEYLYITVQFPSNFISDLKPNMENNKNIYYIKYILVHLYSF